MAILLPNKDGSSSAKIGDIVVTGGGIFEKTATGSVRRSDLETTSNYYGGVDSYHALTTSVYDKVRSAITSGGSGSSGSGGSGGSGATTTTTETTSTTTGATDPAPQDTNNYDLNYDLNGIGYISGFDPNAYAATTTTTSNTTIKNVLGYITLGLIGLVILERIIDK